MLSLEQSVDRFKGDMVDEDTNSIIGLIKAAIVALITWVAGAFMKNPIGTVTALIGLLYLYEKWRTQKALRKKAENEVPVKKQEDDGQDIGNF